MRSIDIPYGEGLEAREPTFAQVVERYEWLLQEMRLLPFRSMIRHAARELATGGRLRQRLDGRIRHVLVDEFQDMNRMQDQILGYFLDLGADLTVVGDDDQAIYQGREASPALRPANSRLLGGGRLSAAVGESEGRRVTHSISDKKIG